MNHLLRSMVLMGTEDINEIKKNIIGFLYWGVVGNSSDQQKLVQLITDYYNKMNAPPGYQYLLIYADEYDVPEIKQLLTAWQTDVPYLLTGADFGRHAQEIFEQQRNNRLLNLYGQASQIITHELKEGREVYSGAEDSVKYLVSKATNILASGGHTRLDGNILDEMEELKQEYLEAKNNPLDTTGVFFGYNQLDNWTCGLRPGQVMLMAGYAGECKTTLSINVAYNACIFYKKNVGYITLEQTRPEIRRIFGSVHSTHQQFSGIHDGLAYTDIDSGNLTTEGENFYFDQVMADIKSGKYGKCGFQVYQPNGRCTAADCFLQAMKWNTQQPLDLLIIDYVNMLDPEPGKIGKSQQETASQMLRDIKAYARNFCGGRGIPVISPVQINRVGKENALLRDKKYIMGDLAITSEAERTPDFILATWLDADLRAQKHVQIQFLKARNRDLPLESFELYADLKYKKIRDLLDTQMLRQATMQSIVI